MRSLYLLLALPLAACGGDESPAVVETTDVTIETPMAPDTLAVEESEPLAEEPVAGEERGEETAPVPAAPAEGAAGAPAATSAFDAREGELGQVLVGGWTIVTGPAETVTFNADGTYTLYAHDRPMGSGAWNAEEGILYLGDEYAYVLDARRARGLTFAGGPDDTFVIERIDE